VKAVDQVGLVLGLTQHAAPASGVGQRPDEQVRVLAPAPVRGRVGQLDPVPLGLLTGRVLDHRDRATLGRGARLARRTQPPGPKGAGHRRVRAVVAQLEQLVEQRRGPQVRVIPQPLPAVRSERLERVRAAARPDPGLATGQIRPDRLTVPTEVAGDR